ncbi:exopolysaccharide biosynthesis protein [Cribrihabitans neustonicus]|uniref:exopolysaccharide biosynthesis protein n=1 Tax=Cribrihabitans neustonicus TaxID=1429085 RepID=UPI003B59F129
MKDHGFKAFHRRGRPAPDARPGNERDGAELPAGQSCPEPSEVAPAAAFAAEPQLPAHLPELWERIPLAASAVTSASGAQNAVRLPLVSRFRQDPAVKAFDLLRTRLLHTLKARGWKRVAVTAPASSCGTTFSAVNLALSLARVPGSRTLLMDMNFRRPGLAAALGIAPEGTVAQGWNQAAFLAGRTAAEAHLRRPLPGLAVGLNSHPGLDAAEILHDSACAATLDRLIERSRADVALFDLPPVLEHDDVAAFLPQVDAVLLISDGTGTTAAELAACEKMLAGHTQLLGVALNRARRAAGPMG